MLPLRQDDAVVAPGKRRDKERGQARCVLLHGVCRSNQRRDIFTMRFEFVTAVVAECPKCQCRYIAARGHNCNKLAPKGIHPQVQITRPINLPDNVIYHQSSERRELVQLRERVKELEDRLDNELYNGDTLRQRYGSPPCHHGLSNCPVCP